MVLLISFKNTYKHQTGNTSQIEFFARKTKNTERTQWKHISSKQRNNLFTKCILYHKWFFSRESQNKFSDSNINHFTKIQILNAPISLMLLISFKNACKHQTGIWILCKENQKHRANSMKHISSKRRETYLPNVFYNTIGYLAEKAKFSTAVSLDSCTLLSSNQFWNHWIEIHHFIQNFI